MSDTSFGDAGSGDSGGKSGSDSSSSGSFSPLGLGVLGAGALGFGALLAEGPGSLPPEYGQLTSNVPNLQAEAGSLEGAGGQLVGQGEQALAMAQAGQLTPEQQAQLSQYQSGLTNQARQQFYSMGRNPDQDTAFISQSGNIDTQVNAMAQQQIQSTIQLGLGEISGGNSLSSTGLGFENAANQALIAAGQAQIQLDQQYSSSLTGAFSAIGSLFGAALKVSDRNMKRNVDEVGALFDGTPVYRFQYVGSPDWEIGVMAQDVEKFVPEAVQEIGGVKHVDVVKATERSVRT